MYPSCSKFIIGYRFSDEFQVDVDVSVYEGMTEILVSDLHTWIRVGEGAWKLLAFLDLGFIGEVGVRAKSAP